MVRIARVVAPDIPSHITQGGTGGTAGEMSMVSPELLFAEVESCAENIFGS